jgi:hypothetical protein
MRRRGVKKNPIRTMKDLDRKSKEIALGKAISSEAVAFALIAQHGPPEK